METTQYFNILNIGTALPIVFRGSSELYEQMYDHSFIHKCGNSYYEYRIENKSFEKPKYEYMYKGYKVMDIIHILASFDAEKEFNETISNINLESHYQSFIYKYRKHFKKYERWSIERFCDEMRKYFNGEKSDIYFCVCSEEYKRLFWKLIKTIFFYNDAMHTLSRYRYGVFKVTKLPFDIAEEKLKYCILVAGGDFHKALYDNISKRFCH